jgi:phosphohistidine phosphatase
MDLILWRHADAEPGDPDLERKLTAKGKKQANSTAQWLRPKLPRDVLLLVSPARRARQTAEALTETFRIDAALAPGASAHQLLAAAGWPDSDGTVVVVGHQPTLGRAAALALTGAEADWGVKKAGVWWLACRDGRADVTVRAVVSPDFV